MSAKTGWGPPPRTPKGQFTKGVSGNRRGRPRKTERAYTHSQIRNDILGLMEKEIEIKIMGKTERMPIILAIYWRMHLSAVEGNERMMLAVVALRETLLSEHKAEHLDLIEMVETFEKVLVQNGTPLDSDTQALLNNLRKQTRGTT